MRTGWGAGMCFNFTFLSITLYLVLSFAVSELVKTHLLHVGFPVLIAELIALVAAGAVHRVCVTTW